MDNQNHDPINSQSEVGTTETPMETSTGATDGAILDHQTAPTQEFNFMDSLDNEYRNNPSIQKFANPNDMAKSYLSLSNMLGKEKAVIPQDLENAEAMSEYMSKVGRPEDVNGYELGYDQESLGRDLDLNGFKEVALANNMTNAQASGLIDWYSKNMQSGMAQESESREASISKARTELRQEFGAGYDEKMSKANTFFKNNFESISGDSALVEQLGNNPSFIRDLSKLTARFSESSIGDIPKQVTLTPADAKQERTKLMNTEAYSNPMNSEHKQTVLKARELLQLQLS